MKRSTALVNLTFIIFEDTKDLIDANHFELKFGKYFQISIVDILPKKRIKGRF